MAHNKIKFGFILAALLWASLRASADEAWTDSLSSKEGNYAARVDPESRMVTVLRSDDRAGRGRLRVKLGVHTLELRPIEGAHAPWRYAGAATGWDGIASTVELEGSDDGKRWRSLGVFRRP